MTGQKKLEQTLVIMGLLLALFFFHRIMIREYIGLDLISTFAGITKVYFIGLLSDFWIASLLTLPFLISPNRFYLLLLLPSLAFGLATQVPYVEFFQTSLRWVHLPYLVDTEFIRSSGTFFERPRVWLSLLWGWGLSAYGISTLKLLKAEAFREDNKNSFSSRMKILAVFLVLAIAANALSHRWSRDLNFSGKLTQNPFVQLVLDGVEQNKIQSESKPREQDVDVLRAVYRSLESKAVSETNMNPASLLANASQDGGNNGSDLRFISEHLKGSFSEAELKKENRYFIVVIAESLRAAESHLLTPGSSGFTPALDRVSERGLAYSSGFSSSVVSRSGAESSVCNFISTISLNTMRDNPVEKSMCAREIFQNRLGAKGIASSFSWLHGGYHGFDNQGQFYRTAGFEVPFDILKLSADLPRTHWGLSDKTLMALSAGWFAEREKLFQSGLHFVALVTVSNHTAWDLPPDADKNLVDLQKKEPSGHFAAVRYADGALGDFIENLKKQGIWQKAVMVIVGDHGTQVPADGVGSIPGFGHSLQGDLKTAEHLSRVYFSLSGGLVEQGVEECKKQGRCKSGLIQTRPVSQIDILPTMADILPLSDKVPWFGVSLLKQNRLWPVFSDLGDYFYIPESSKALMVKKDVFISDEAVPLSAEWRNFSAFMRLYASLVRQGRLRESLYGEGAN